MKSVFSSAAYIWKTDKLRLILIGCFIFVYSWVYRVALRTLMDGSPFRWANTMHTTGWGEARKVYIYGSGTDGHLVIILLLALFFSAILYLLIRRPDAFTKVLLSGWVIIFLIWQLIISIGLGTEYTLSGDTFGVLIPYYIIGPAEQGVMLLLVLAWIINTRNKTTEYFAFTGYQTRWLIWLISVYLPMYLLLNFGQQDGLTDQLGIMVLYFHLLTMVILLLPQKEKSVVQ